MLKVFDVYNGWSEEFWRIRGAKIVDNVEECDIVNLNGGEDISPEIYKEKVVAGSPYVLTRRDKLESTIYHEAKEQGKFIFAICRGAQLVCALEGGSLWQHVNNHGSSHRIIDVRTGKIYKSTSVHHQMMRPQGNFEIIAKASEATMKLNDTGQVTRVLTEDLMHGDDPEIVWYPDARALCVQGHPEFVPRTEFADYCFELAMELMEHNSELRAVNG